MRKIINPWRNHEGYNCFGCSPDNPIGLHLEFYEDGDYIGSENWLKGSVEYENEEFQHLGSVVTNNGYSDWATTA